jgi:type VI secretion system secreted protein VgrG
MMKTESIGLAYMQNIGLGKMVNIGLAYNINVGTMMSTNVGITKSTKVGKSYELNVGSAGGSSGPSDQALTSNIVASSPPAGGGGGGGGAIFTMDADSIKLKVGECNFVMNKDGTASLNGVDLTFTGTSSITHSSPDIKEN